MGPANGSNGVSGIGRQHALSVWPTRSPGDNHPMATLSGQPLPRSPECSPVAELCSCLGLFAVGIAINIALVQCANAQFWLTGEEGSVAFKDVVFLRLRLQHCRYDTNLGGHILYFLAYAVHPHPGLWYGRETKAVLMALAGPLTYLFARRLGLGFAASTFSGLCIFLFPGFSSFSWIGMEAGLEVLFGGLALYLAYGRSIWTWPLAAASLGFGILVYGGGAAFVVPFVGLIGWRVWRDRDRRSLVCALVAAGVFVGVLALPSLWWVNTSHAYRGGGTIELVRAPVLFLRLLYESFYKPHSYYFFSTSPALGGVLLLPLLAEGLDWAIQSRRLSRAAVVTVALAVVLLLASQTLATARALSDQRLVLPRDRDWIGTDMKSLLENQVVDPRTREAVLELEYPMRAMCLFYLLQDRPRRASDPSFSLEEIRDYYLTTDSVKFK